ncbi:response regulator [Bacteroides sp. OttesenSCG-928-N06]|nr:response regulator [Bacteroides sp. OttesenSCG-928-N06]
MKIKLVFLIGLFLITIYNANGTVKQIPTANLHMKDGLSSQYVTDIAQDKSGFIWLATRYGLNRYDGNKFTVYIKAPDREMLNSNEMHRVEADTICNKVWIAHRWAGINVFDCETETFTAFLHDASDNNSLISNEVMDILVASDGSVWIATIKGLELYDPHSAQFIHYNASTVPGFPSDGINTLAEGVNGEIYLGHFYRGFSVFTPQDKKIRNFRHISGHTNSLPDNKVYSIFSGIDSKVWIATGKGLSLLDPSTETFRNFADTDGLHPSIRSTVLCVYQSGDGRIWAGTSSDLCYFDIKDADKILSGEKDVNHTFIQDINWGITNPTVLRIHEDFFGNIWIGSNGGGASFISNTSSFFQSWRIDKIPGVINGLNDKEVLTLCVDNQENIWIGTDGGGLNVNKEGRNCEFYSSQTGEVSSITYLSSLRDSNNNLWFGSINLEIDLFKHKEQRFSRYKVAGKPSPIYCLFEDNRRNIWIGSNNGLEIYNPVTGEKNLLNQSNSDLQANTIRAVSQDKHGNMWIGTLNRGITIYNPLSGEMNHLNDPAIFSNNQINQILKDSQNRMWIATTKGLLFFPDEQTDSYQLFNSKNGLACNMVCSMAEDSQGNIWLSTNTGISCFIESEKRFLNYDPADGALYGAYMPNSVTTTQDGTIYFGSINGVCYFNPADRPVDVALPPVIFTEFKVHSDCPHEDEHGASLPMTDRKVTLKYHRNTFSVSFNVMDKSLQGKVEYAYKLDGLTNTWVNTAGENTVTFRNISHNNYKLQVKARYKNQAWPEHYSTLAITINPPLWLTWWAKLLYFICFVALVFIIIRVYKRRLQLHNSLILEKEKTQKQQELNEERLRFYTNITHELRTPLTLILGPLEDLQNDAKVQQEHKKQLSLIHKSAIRLLNLVTRILEFRKTETRNKKLQISKADISEKIKEIGLKYKELNRKSNVRFDIVIDTHKTQLYFDPDVVTMILDNLLSNAFKYTQSGNIALTLQTVSTNEVDYTEIEVRDTGIGIPEEELNLIFERYYRVNKHKNSPGFGIGLALVKNLVDLHEGIILVDSKAGIGSSFRIRLVTNNTYPDAIHIDTTPDELNVETENEKTNKPIILIVEDEDDIRDYIAGALTASYDVIVAENGEQGLKAAQTSIPDIIVSDVMMPIMDGMELCREIKSNIETSHIPVILLTAKDALQDKAQGYNAGADSYITKPFSASLLKSRVSNLLEAKRKTALLFSSNNALKRSVVKDSLNKIDNEFLEKMSQIIEENLMNEKIDVTVIAQELSMSYSSLYRKIKALTGVSTGDFIRKIRMRKAEELLLSGKYNISEIANLVGLNSMSYFRECFKEEYGESPSEYIRRIKGE